MRRVALAAVCAAVFVAACSDNSRETPLEPSTGTQVMPPTANVRCSPPPFPLASITLQVGKVFPKGPLLIEALAREAIIVAYWGTCQPAKAQEAVASFVGFTLRNFQAQKIGAGNPRTSTPAAVSSLIDAMLVAVGLQPANLPLGPVTAGTDFGTGFADGTSTGMVVVKTNSGTASSNFQGNAFGQPTVVTLFRRPNTDQLNTQGQANQFAPYYDYSASNAGNNHIVLNGQLLVGFCLEQGITYPADVEVGHNPVQTNGPTNQPSGLPFFEILARLTQNEYNSLGLTACPTLRNPLVQVGLKFGEGLPALASSAWRTAGAYLGRAAEQLLPARAFAVVVPTSSGVGGRTSSYSPFGVVEPVSPIQYGSTGYRYLVVGAGSPPSDFQSQGFDDSGWATGDAGFGFNDLSNNCSLIASDTRTAWPANTQLLLRRQFTVPGGGSTAVVRVAIDNDIKVFVNGTNITHRCQRGLDGFAEHDGCPTRGSLTFTATNLNPGVNLLVIQARDRGGSTFVDVSVDPNTFQ